MAKVSVIVPVYNTEKYLRRCMDALIEQTLKDIEVIAVDDGSTDHSGEMLQRYREEYPEKVKVFTKENGGQAAARNFGISKSTGEYIGFADSDDYVDLTMFEKMYRLAAERDCDMVECHYFYLHDTGHMLEELKTRGNIREYGSKKEMFLDPQVSPWNKIYRREVLLKPGIYFPEGLIYEDTSFYIKSILNLKKTAYLDEHLVYYLLRDSSTMNANKSRRVADIFPVLEDLLNFYRMNGAYEEYREELEYFCVKILFCSSLSRIGRVTDRKLEQELLDRTFSFIEEHFPDYKVNHYFTGRTGMYIRHMNRARSKPAGRLLGRIMKG